MLKRKDIDKLILELRKRPVDVTFNKTDGTVRKMRCNAPPELPDTAFLGEVFTVWDLEKKDWRSFRRDSVVEYRPAKK